MTMHINFSVLQTVMNAENGVNAVFIANAINKTAAEVLTVLNQFVATGDMRFDRRDADFALVNQRVYTLRTKREALKAKLEAHIAENSAAADTGLVTEVLRFIKNAESRRDTHAIAAALNKSVDDVSSAILDLVEDGYIRRDRRDGKFFTEPTKREEITRMLTAPTAPTAIPVSVSAAPGFTPLQLSVLKTIRRSAHRMTPTQVVQELGTAGTDTNSSDVINAMRGLLHAGLLKEDTRRAGNYYTNPTKRDEVDALLTPATPTPRPTVDGALPVPFLKRVLSFIKNSPHRVEISHMVAAAIGLTPDLQNAVQELLSRNLLKRDSCNGNAYYTNPANQDAVNAFLVEAPTAPAPVAPTVGGDPAQDTLVAVLRVIKNAPHRQNVSSVADALGLADGVVVNSITKLKQLNLIVEDGRRAGNYYTNPQNQEAVTRFLTTPAAPAPAGRIAVLDKLQLAVLRAIKEAPSSLHYVTISERLDEPVADVERAISVLVTQGYLKQHANKPSYYFTVPAKREEIAALLELTADDTLVLTGVGEFDDVFIVQVLKAIKDAPNSQTLVELATTTGLSHELVDEALNELADLAWIREHRTGGKWFTNSDYSDEILDEIERLQPADDCELVTDEPEPSMEIMVGTGAPALPVNGPIYRTIFSAPHSLSADQVSDALGLRLDVVEDAIQNLVDADLLIEHRDGEKWYTNEDLRGVAEVLLEL